MPYPRINFWKLLNWNSHSNQVSLSVAKRESVQQKYSYQDTVDSCERRLPRYHAPTTNKMNVFQSISSFLRKNKKVPERAEPIQPTRVERSERSSSLAESDVTDGSDKVSAVCWALELVPHTCTCNCTCPSNFTCNFTCFCTCPVAVPVIVPAPAPVSALVPVPTPVLEPNSLQHKSSPKILDFYTLHEDPHPLNEILEIPKFPILQPSNPKLNES